MSWALSSGAFTPAMHRLAAWKTHALALGLTWAALLMLFHRDVLDLLRIYWTSTTYGHCLFVAPVVGWLAWQRRAGLAELRPVAWWPGLALVGAGGVAWLMGAAAGVAIARHLGLVVMLQGAVVTLLGSAVARGLAFPLAYMLFLVPFGDSFEAPLQTLTVRMVMPLLHLAGVPASVDGVLITIPKGVFEVAEACSGAKFLIAMIAYSALVANVCFVSWRRRAAFLVAGLVVPVLANGLRAFGTIYAAHLTSVEAATGIDHIVYGWVFFGLVMALVLAIGWRWFDRDPDAPWVDPAALAGPVRAIAPLWSAAGGAIGVAVLSAAWSVAIAGRADALPARIDLPEVPGWHRVPMSSRADWSPHFPGADHFLIGRYARGEGPPVDLAIAVYASQQEGRELVAFGQGALRENDVWVRVADMPDLRGGKAIRMVHPGPVERQTVTWYSIGGVVTGDERRVKLETLKAKLLGGRQAAIAVLVSAERQPGADPRAAILAFLNSLGPIERVVERVTR